MVRRRISRCARTRHGIGSASRAIAPSFHRRTARFETRTESRDFIGDLDGVARITLFNRSLAPREIELTSYSEIVLAPSHTDRAHPAFGNLFVQTEWMARESVRFLRCAGQDPPRHAGVVRSCCREQIRAVVSCETDRANFVGSAGDRCGIQRPWSTTVICRDVSAPYSIRLRNNAPRLSIPAGGSAQATFTTFMAELIATSGEQTGVPVSRCKPCDGRAR